MLRAVRYAGRLGLRLQDDTERLLKRDLHYLDTISGDRIRHELERIFREDRVVPILHLARQSGILSAIHPSLTLDEAVLKRIENMDKGGLPEYDLLFFSAIAYCAPANQHEGLIRRLNMGSGWAKVVRDTAGIKAAFNQLREQELPNSMIYAVLRPFDQSALQSSALFANDSIVSSRIELYLSGLMRVRGLLDGDDIKALGVPEGPEIGQILGEILDARLDGGLVSRQDEVDFVLRRIKSG
jgi:tRNA nucleotidyltransferase (CCA-adding enzyme)